MAGAAAAPSGVPNYLAPLSPQQISNQATSQVKKAYAPAFNEVRSQRVRAQAIYDKQTSDNQYYTQWLATQATALQAHNDAAHQQLEGQIGQLTAGDTQSNQVNQTSSMNNQQFLAANQQDKSGYLDSVGQGALQGIGNSNDALAATSLNNVNAVLAGQDKENATLQSTENSLNASSSDLISKQAAAITSAIQDANKTEVAKAEYNQNFGIATQKLGVSEADAQTSRMNATTSANRLNETISQDATRNMQSDRTYNLDVSKYNQVTAKDLYERQHGLGPYKPVAGVKPPLSQVSQNVIYGKISTIQGRMQQLESGFQLTPEQAWHALHNGVFVQDGKTVKIPGGGPVGDTGLLNAAYNTRQGANGLTAGDLNYLHSLGMSNVNKRLQVAPTPGSPQGAAQSVLNLTF